MRSPPFPVLKALLRADLSEDFYHQGFAKYGV